MKNIEQKSVLSIFLKREINAKLFSIKKFAKKFGIDEKSVYTLLSAKRKIKFIDQTFNKVVTALDLAEEKKKYILDLAASERKSGKIIYPSSESTSLQESLPSEPVLLSSELSSIEVKPIKDVKKKHIISVSLSILSSFLQQKFSAKGLSIKKFSEKTGISERSVYRFLVVKKDFSFSDEMLNKIAIGLELTEEDRNYILDLADSARKERRTIICLSNSIPLQEPLPSEPSSIVVEPVKELDKEQSIHIFFLQQKFTEKGLSVKKFAEKAGISERTVYNLLSVKREFNFSDGMLNKIANGLELTEEDRKYILDLAASERKSGKIIYPSASILLQEPLLSEPVLLPSLIEPSSIEFETVTELDKEHIVSAHFRILSSFLQQKFLATGLSVKKFTEKSGISERTVYRFLYVKKDFRFSDETLNKIANGLELTEEDKKYILDLADSVRKEREEIICPSESIPFQEPLLSESFLFEPVLLPSEPSLIEVEPVICSSNILEEERGLFPLNEILIPEQFIKTPPGRWKIEETIGYYKKHGKFDKPIKVNRNTMMLTDGYKRYVAAKELKLTEVQVQFVGREKQVSTIKKQVVEEPPSKKAVLEVIEELPHKKSVLVEGEEFCFLSEIIIPKTFHFPPGKKTIGKAINFYRQHGKFPNSIIINKENKNLIEGYKYYMAAKELGLIEIGVKFIEKEKAKSSNAVKSIEKEKTRPSGLDFCQLSEIIIPEQFIKIPPGKEKIEEIVSSYRKHGKFDNPLKVIRQIILVDGYKSYIAAKELGLTEIEVKFISTPVQETIKLLIKEEKEKKDIPVLVKKKIKPAISVVAKNLKGSIKKIVSGKGYGFINGDDREVYFFHQSGLRDMDIDELDLEYRVTFDLIEGLKGSQAVNIKQDFG